MPCKIQIKKNLTNKVEELSNDGLGKSLPLAKKVATRVNDAFKTKVVDFVMVGDTIDRVVDIPNTLVEVYFANELTLESKQVAKELSQNKTNTPKIASTIYELNPNITEQEIKVIYNNYVKLMGVRREGKEVSYTSFKLILAKLQVFNYNDTYIFGEYDKNKGVFVTRFNSSPTSKELLAEAHPALVSSGIDVISFVPKDIADKLVRSGYTSSNTSFKYNFKGEIMQKYAVGSNARVFEKVFNKSHTEVSSEEIEQYNKSFDFKYNSVAIDGNLVRQAGDDLNRILETYLNQFGIVVKDIENIESALGIDSLGFADILSKIAYVKDKKDLPPIAGEFIAYMMQYNPLVKDIIVELTNTKDYKSLDKSEHFKIIGKLIAEDLQNKLDGKYSKSLVDKIKELIGLFFDLFKQTPVSLINTNIGIISNNILQQNKNLITSSLYKPGAFGKPVTQVSLEKAISFDKFGASIIRKLSNQGFILTGSTALSEQGTILRPDENPLHDIDWINPFSREDGKQRFLQEYPNAIFIRDIPNEDYITDSWLIAPEGYEIKNQILTTYSSGKGDKVILESYDVVKDGKVEGTFRLETQNGNLDEVVKGVEGKVIDFFTVKTTGSIVVNNVNLANWKHIFKAKLEFARYKDVWDYNRFIPNENIESFLSQKENNLVGGFVKYDTSNTKQELTNTNEYNPQILDETITEFNPFSDDFEVDTTYSIDEVKEKLYQTANGYTKNIFDIIYEPAKKLNINVLFLSDSDFRNRLGTRAIGLHTYGSVAIRKRLLTPIGQEEHVIVHELIHSVTSYIIYGIDSKDKNIMKNVTPQQIKARNDLKSLFAVVKKRAVLAGEYGITNEHEFLAELSNPEFVKKLNTIDTNFVAKILRTILDIIGVVKIDEAAFKILYDLISNPIDYYDGNNAYKDTPLGSYEELTLESKQITQELSQRDDNVEIVDDTKYQLLKEQSENIIASEKTIRDIAARMSDRIGIPVKFENDRTKEYKGKIENNVAYQDTLERELPKEIVESVTLLTDVPIEILGRSDLFLSMSDVFTKKGITNPLLINWFGISLPSNMNRGTAIKNVKSENEIEEQALKSYNKQIALEDSILKDNEIKESFDNWIQALELYPVVFKDLIFKHAVKNLRDKDRKEKFVLQINKVALKTTFDFILKNPHELNRVGKVYDKIVVETITQGYKKTPTKNGKGFWILIPRTDELTEKSKLETIEHHKNLLKNSHDSVRELEQSLNLPTNDKQVKEQLSYALTAIKNTINNLEYRIEVLQNTKVSLDGEFEKNVNTLKVLSPSSWCTATTHADTYTRRYNNHLLIINNQTVAGIEYKDNINDETGLYDVADVTDRNNSSILLDEYLDEILYLMRNEKINTNNSVINSIKHRLNLPLEGDKFISGFENLEERNFEAIEEFRIGDELPLDFYLEEVVNAEDFPFSKTNQNQIQGYYDSTNDKVVVITSNTPLKDVSKVAIHEVAHRGMIRMAKDLGGMGSLFKVLLSAEKQLMEKLPFLLERTGHANVESLMFDYGFDVNTPEGKSKLLIELAARWAESLVNQPKPTWWEEFTQLIQNWIKQFTGKTLNEQEVNELVGGFVKYGTKQQNNLIDFKPLHAASILEDMVVQNVITKNCK